MSDDLDPKTFVSEVYRDAVRDLEIENARLRDELAAAEAENARLREGLEMISNGCQQPRLVARGVLFHEQCRSARAAALSPATEEAKP